MAWPSGSRTITDSRPPTFLVALETIGATELPRQIERLTSASNMNNCLPVQEVVRLLFGGVRTTIARCQILQKLDTRAICGSERSYT